MSNKSAIRCVLGLLALLLCNSAFAADRGWQISEQTDPMYGGRTVILKLYADGSGDSLVIQCDRKRTQVAYGVWAGALTATGRVPILTKIDQGTPQHAQWLYDTSGWYRAPNPVAFVRKLSHTTHLLLEYQPAIGSAQLDQFTLSGLDALLPKVASACGWKLP
jgi:hypothetical protein